MPVCRATQYWQTYLFMKKSHDFEIFLHMSVGLPGPLQTAFELTNLKICVKKYARCDYTTLHALNWLKRLKTSETKKTFSQKSLNVEISKISKSGGLLGHFVSNLLQNTCDLTTLGTVARSLAT